MEKKIKVTALCTGIKDRDRKTKPQRYELGYLNHETIEQVTDREIEICKENAKTWAYIFKQVSNLRLNLKPVKLKEDQFGTTESYIMFTDKTIPIQ